MFFPSMPVTEKIYLPRTFFFDCFVYFTDSLKSSPIFRSVGFIHEVRCMKISTFVPQSIFARSFCLILAAEQGEQGGCSPQTKI